MASSSSSHQGNEERSAFFGIEPAGERRRVSESSSLFDVFINHRGPDVKLTLATHFYNSLHQLGIRTFLDSQEKEFGISFPSTIETAIRSASVHIAIFSKGYADSAWCLAELVLMLESNAKIIPLFYQVKPSDLRHIETGVYAEAFIKYEKKGRYLEKLNEWKGALQSLSLIAGEEIGSFSEWDCQKMVAAVQKEVQRKTPLHVADYPVGLNNLVGDFEKRCLDKLVQDFENQCTLKEGKHKVKVVGIFGMGGVGKTTLAKELFNRKTMNYSRASFLFDVREASVRSQLTSLQSQLCKDLFCKDLSFKSTEEGISYLKDHLGRSPPSSFLIVVDDIDHVEQLNALRVMDILDRSCDSLVIVTTRDIGVLITTGITVGYNLKVMDRDYGRELFCCHAFGQPHLDSGYEELVNSFVELCAGLPLSLQVLGRHVHGRTKDYWSLELNKVSKILPRDVMKRLKISFDALDAEEKQVFIDIACFFIDKPKSIAEKVWERSRWNAQHALGTLKDKCLVHEIKFWDRDRKKVVGLRMHDHLRDLGRELALELSPPHRLWRPQDLRSLELKGFETILAKANVRCFHSIFHKSMGSQVTFFLGQSDICFETSGFLLWLQLEGNSKEQPSIPSGIPLQNLQYLKIEGGRLKRLWKNSMQVPTQLKELQISETSLKEFPDLENGGNSTSVKAAMSDLEKLEISGERSVPKILISGIAYPSLKSIKLHGMKNLMEVNLTRVKTLNLLDIADCKKLKRLTGTSDLTNLVLLSISKCPDLEFADFENAGHSTSVKAAMSGLEKLEITGEAFVSKILISGIAYPSLKSIKLHGMENLMEVNLTRVKTLNLLDIAYCKKLKRLTGTSDLTNLMLLSISKCPDLEIEDLRLRGMNCLESIKFDEDVKVKIFELDGCQILKTLEFGCKELVELIVRGCPELKELPCFIAASCLERIIVDGCEICRLHLNGCQNLRSVSGNFVLTGLSAYGCPELEELPSLARLSCLEYIVIDSCDKLKNIYEELHATKYMYLNYCSNAVIRNCIHKLKSIPSEGMVMIGRVVDGAESTLNESLFLDAHIGADAVTRLCPSVFEAFQIDKVGLFEKWEVWSAVIVCFMIVVDSSTYIEDINQSLSYYPRRFGLNVRQGEWIITMVEYGRWSDFQYYFKKIYATLTRHRIMKKGFWVAVKKGERWESVDVLQTIVNRLYHV